MSLPATQSAIAIPAKRTPLIQVTAPVYPPQQGEIVLRVEWTASTPLDLHKADGGLLITSYPALAGGGGAAGTVVAVGSGDAADLKGLEVGDRVVSFAFRGGKEANHQEYITIPSYLASKIPSNVTLQEAVTVSVNLVTVFHTFTADLGLALPWPIPQGWTPPDAEKPVLVWGASSSVGLFAVEVLRHWGYRRILAVSSGKHHEHLKSLGAGATFDYTKENVVDNIIAYVKGLPEPRIPYLLDCIGSIKGTLEPLSKIATEGSIVAVMLPIIRKDATDDEEPEYEMEIANAIPESWADGVTLRGVRTHFYLANEFFKEKLQSEIVPTLLAQGIVHPNNQRIVEGATRLERAQKALDLLRSRAISGERLVWKVSDE